jgi:hypothetical protein
VALADHFSLIRQRVITTLSAWFRNRADVLSVAMQRAITFARTIGKRRIPASESTVRGHLTLLISQ